MPDDPVAILGPALSRRGNARAPGPEPTGGASPSSPLPPSWALTAVALRTREGDEPVATKGAVR